MRRELSGKAARRRQGVGAVRADEDFRAIRQVTPEQAMNPIRIEPQRALDDAVRFNQKLAAGLKTLRTLDDVSYGTTDKEEVYREDKLVLYRFKGSKAPTAKTPLLIAYALVNRPYMVDLQDDRSLVKNLLALGEDVI
jgi:polyhydroxyalkanoate synthase